MINHARTLLANLDGQGPATAPGEEYTEPGFRAVALPAHLRAIHAILFGPAPDRRTVLWRTRQYMAILHASSLKDEALALDPRLTYNPDPSDDEPMPEGVSLLAVGDNDAPLFVVGEPPAADARGRSEFRWTVEFLA